jgi:hypothetical protein
LQGRHRRPSPPTDGRLWRSRSDVAGIIREIGDTGQASIDIVLDFPTCCNRIAGLKLADALTVCRDSER